ncbi:hypothetical protein [Anaerorhabdus furcosa]|uniref:Lipoprotein n=1 Tax=Anaerorhabdus furcosa TaxID=118967 RepID=A0A1T4JZP7_9FIRM|nr:hypothetical protein [Anaerorhabdus furcosa]SJZ35505.1 hypothetical protein SAMN02745191_0187 [Anaerorhabdus furcosa]
MKKIILFMTVFIVVGCSSKEINVEKKDTVSTIEPTPMVSEKPFLETCKLRGNSIEVLIENGFYTADNIVYKRKGESGEIEHTFNIETLELIGPFGSNATDGYKYSIKNNTIDFQGCLINLNPLTTSGSNCSDIKTSNLSDSIYSIQQFIAYYLFECDDITKFSRISSEDLQSLMNVLYEK